MSRIHLVFAAVVLASAVAAVWTTKERTSARTRLATAVQEEASCRAAAGQIHSLRRSTPVDSANMTDTEIASMLEAAAKNAGIGPDQLVRIWPAPPHRLKDQAYSDRATDVTVQGVSLKQSVLFLAAVREARPTFTLPKFRLAARTEKEGGWTLDATISFRVHAPDRPKQSTPPHASDTLPP